MKKFRKMTYVVWAWCIGIVVWAIAGASSAQSDADCASEATQDLQKLCQDATDVGTGIGVALVLFIGFFGFVFLSIIWFMTRPKQQVVIVQGGES